MKHTLTFPVDSLSGYTKSMNGRVFYKRNGVQCSRSAGPDPKPPSEAQILIRNEVAHINYLYHQEDIATMQLIKAACLRFPTIINGKTIYPKPYNLYVKVMLQAALLQDSIENWELVRPTSIKLQEVVSCTFLGPKSLTISGTLSNPEAETGYMMIRFSNTPDNLHRIPVASDYVLPDLPFTETNFFSLSEVSFSHQYNHDFFLNWDSNFYTYYELTLISSSYYPMTKQKGFAETIIDA